MKITDIRKLASVVALAGALLSTAALAQEASTARDVTFKQVGTRPLFSVRVHLFECGRPHHDGRRARDRHAPASARRPGLAGAHPQAHGQAGSMGDQQSFPRRPPFRQRSFQGGRCHLRGAKRNRPDHGQSKAAHNIAKLQPNEMARRVNFFKSRCYDPAEVSLVLPDVTFDSEMTIRLGGREARLAYLGPGQQAGDTFVFFPHARMVFTTGMFGPRSMPNMAFTPSVENWIKLLDQLAAMDVDK